MTTSNTTPVQHKPGCMGAHDYRDCTCGATTPNGTGSQNAELKAKYGSITWNGRRFAIGGESICGRELKTRAVYENNGDGKEPVVHVAGISGSYNNAIRVMERYVNKLARATSTGASRAQRDGK